MWRGGCESESGSSGGFGVGKGMLGGDGGFGERWRVEGWGGGEELGWCGRGVMRVKIGIDGVIWLVVRGVGGVGDGERV